MAVPYHFSGDEKLANFVEVTPPTSMSPIEDEKKPLILEEKVKLKAEGTDVQGMMDETVKRVREQSDRYVCASLPFAPSEFQLMSGPDCRKPLRLLLPRLDLLLKIGLSFS